MALSDYANFVKRIARTNCSRVSLYKKDGELIVIKAVTIFYNDYDIYPHILLEPSIFLKMNHPNIMKLQDVFILGKGSLSSLCMVMKYMKRGTLADLTSTRSENLSSVFGIPFVLQRKIFYEILCAVSYLHSKSIIHRDIKPQNILIDEDGSVKLTDFGLAKTFLNSRFGLTEEVVTLWYRPPEIFLGDTHYSYSIDVWSLGCLLYNILTRTHLFEGKNEKVVMKKIVSIFGAPTNKTWPNVEKLPYYSTYELSSLPTHNNFFKLKEKIEECTKKYTVAQKWIEIIQEMLVTNPYRRKSVYDILSSSIFDTIRDSKKEFNIPSYLDILEDFEKKKSSVVTTKDRKEGYGYILSFFQKSAMSLNILFRATSIYDNYFEYYNKNRLGEKEKEITLRVYSLACLYLSAIEDAESTIPNATYFVKEAYVEEDDYSVTHRGTRTNFIQTCLGIISYSHFNMIFSSSYYFLFEYLFDYTPRTSEFLKLCQALLFYFKLFSKNESEKNIALFSILGACIFLNIPFLSFRFLTAKTVKKWRALLNREKRSNIIPDQCKWWHTFLNVFGLSIDLKSVMLKLREEQIPIYNKNE